MYCVYPSSFSVSSSSNKLVGQSAFTACSVALAGTPVALLCYVVVYEGSNEVGITL